MACAAAWGRMPLLLAVLMSALACVVVFTATAAAAEYTVNSIGDQADGSPGTDGCETIETTCTLRAAIEESNVSTGVNDTIKFSASFDGEVGDTIELATPLPTVTDRVRIEGFPSPLQCQADYFFLPGPCVGVSGPPGGTAFSIAAERVVLIGFAISGAQTAIEAVGAPGLEAWNNWLGIKLNGSADPIDTGISLDQNSNGAIVGGSSSVARNIFAHNTSVGVDIEGANFANVRGNGFGVLPDGNTLAANGKNIEITDAATGDNRIAQQNLVGGTLTDEQLADPTCDGACNLIAGASESGIDLVGDDPSEESASGSTRISGNHIGLNAFGTTAISNFNGVLVGSADNVLIGGPRPGDRNMINGGANGVLAESGAGNLTVEGNWIGLAPSGAKSLAPPANSGIASESGHQIDITGNRISMTGGTAIHQGARGAVVRSNAIGKGVGGEDLPGGSLGIHLLESSCEACNLTYGNTIANAAEYGVLIETSRDRVYGNRIEGSGAAGIRIEGPPPGGFATRNIIGGDIAAEENTISRNGGAAVEIAEVVEFGATRANEVARNRGSLNGGPFIELVDGANDDILPPTFSAATRSGASGGGAVPGAVIRVFRKAGSSLGEIESFLAETIADESGGWAVVYPSPIPGGTTVAASQTGVDQGTSELALSTTAAEADSGDDEGRAGAGGIPGQGPVGPAGARPPIPPAPVALVQGKVLVKGGNLLLRVACRRGACGGMLRVIARPVWNGRKGRNNDRAVRRRASLVLIGKRRFRMAAGARRFLRVRLNRRGRALVRRAGRRGLVVRLSGTGVRTRVVRLRQAGRNARQRG